VLTVSGVAGLQAYLGSESEEEQEEAGNGVDAYRALLQEAGEKSGAGRWGGKSWGAASSSDEDEVRCCILANIMW
jgi:hypothetical protein